MIIHKCTYAKLSLTVSFLSPVASLMMAALVLLPAPSPSRKPTATATMFLSAPHMSAAATSGVTRMRNVGVWNSWRYDSARSRFLGAGKTPI